MTVLETPPYVNESLNSIYDLLFCDNPALFRPDEDQLEQYPFNVLFAQEPDIELLQQLVSDKTAESRIRILASKMLIQSGIMPVCQDLLGVVVEVALENGLDVVAAYADGTARYINHSGKIIIWDAPVAESDKLIADILQSSQPVLQRIGPWDGNRLAAPGTGDVRITFMRSGQLYFGQGPFEVLSKDAMGGPVINAALQLIIFLTGH